MIEVLRLGTNWYVLRIILLELSRQNFLSPVTVPPKITVRELHCGLEVKFHCLYLTGHDESISERVPQLHEKMSICNKMFVFVCLFVCFKKFMWRSEIGSSLYINMEARCTCTTCNVLMGPTQLAQNDRVWTLFYAFFQFDIEFFTLWFWGQSQRNIVLTFIIISHLFYI